jgi:3-oxoacyl-(acyl-carrier-protein) synthase
MAINTPLGDTLEHFLEGLLGGRSAITSWRGFDTSRIYSKIGGDLSGYDHSGKLAELAAHMPPDAHRRLRKLVSRAPWSTRLSLLLAADGYRDAGLFQQPPDPEEVAVIVAGHNINGRYEYDNRIQFEDEPDYIDPMLALHGLDTDHAGSISEALQARGPIYTVGAACASGNTALRCAVDEIRYHDVDVALVVGAALEFAPPGLHAMALMGAISYQSFNDHPEAASRPFDAAREGFVPAHGGAVLVLEDLDRALHRGARIYAEVLGVEASSDGNHLPQPSADGQARLIQRTLQRCCVAPDEIDFVSAHATSTPLGDLTEITSIQRVFGEHARRLKVNAPKSMLGHTCWASPTVETVAAVLQMNAGCLHGSINIDELDPEIEASGIDVCAGNAPVRHEVRTLLKNSFGFGGINCVSILRRWDGV